MQRSATSQAPIASRHCTPSGRKPSSGQSSEAPSQISATSQVAPGATGLHNVPAGSGVPCGSQRASPDVQRTTPSSQGRPATAQRIPSASQESPASPTPPSVDGSVKPSSVQVPFDGSQKSGGTQTWPMQFRVSRM
jgi:hypothetical protein